MQLLSLIAPRSIRLEQYFVLLPIWVLFGVTVSPILAILIKKRFLRRGEKIETNRLLSGLRVTGFWHEAARLNEAKWDRRIWVYLFIRNNWVVTLLLLLVVVLSMQFRQES